MGYYRNKYIPQYIPGEYTLDPRTRASLARSWDRLLSLSWQALDLDVSTSALLARRYRAPRALSPWYRSVMHQGTCYPYYAADRRYFHYDPTWYYYPRYRPFPLYHLNYPYWPWTLGGGRSGLSRYSYVRQPLYYSGGVSRLANALITEPPLGRYRMARGSLGDDSDVVVVSTTRKVRSYDDGPIDFSTAAHKAQRITSHTADDFDTIQSKSKRQDQALLSDINARLAHFQSPLIVPNRHVRILPVSWSPNRPIVLTDFVQRPHRRARASSLPPQLERPTKVEFDDPEVTQAFSLGLDMSKHKRYHGTDSLSVGPRYSASQDLSVRQAKRHLNKLERELGLDVFPGGEVVVPTRVTKVGEVVVRGHTGGGGGTHSYHHVSTRVSGGSSGGGVSSGGYDLPLSAHSLGASSLGAAGAGYGAGGLSGLGGLGAGAGVGRSAGAGLHHSPSYHRLPDFLDLAEPDISPSHVRPYVPLGGHGGHVRPGSAGGVGGRRPGAGAGVGAGYMPYTPSHTPGLHVPVHALPSHSAPAYTPGSYGGGGGGGGGHPYHRSPVYLGDDAPSRGRLPRESRASSMPIGGGGDLPPVERFQGKPRSWEPARPREVPAGNFTASRPPRHVEPPLSDVRRRARDVICKTRNDPSYYDY